MGNGREIQVQVRGCSFLSSVSRHLGLSHIVGIRRTGRKEEGTSIFRASPGRQEPPGSVMSKAHNPCIPRPLLGGTVATVRRRPTPLVLLVLLGLFLDFACRYPAILLCGAPFIWGICSCAPGRSLVLFPFCSMFLDWFGCIRSRPPVGGDFPPDKTAAGRHPSIGTAEGENQKTGTPKYVNTTECTGETQAREGANGGRRTLTNC